MSNSEAIMFTLKHLILENFQLLSATNRNGIRHVENYKCSQGHKETKHEVMAMMSLSNVIASVVVLT